LISDLCFQSSKVQKKNCETLKTFQFLLGPMRLLCTYWLSGRAGRENIWLEVMAIRTECIEVHTEWARYKYFPVRPDLTQSISFLSYDQYFGTFLFIVRADEIRTLLLIKKIKQQVRMAFEWPGRLFTARSPTSVHTPSREFSVWFFLTILIQGNNYLSARSSFSSRI
jgi:hypothetical protein